jgi:ABC-type amino acid transport substrate-binding protein
MYCSTLIVFTILPFIGYISAEQVIKATTILEAPYVTRKEGADKSTTNLDDYEGYIPDLLRKIAAISNRKFSLQTVKDGLYGTKTGNGQWNGMIGEVKNGHVDIAAAPITVSGEREAVVKFTDNFMTFDTVVLLKKTPDVVHIRSALQLHNNSHNIKVEMVKDGFTENFFKTTDQNVYNNMYEAMDKNAFPKTASEGVTRVRNGNGRNAFVIESSTADYWQEKAPCDLFSFRLGSALPYHAYAFAVRMGSPVFDPINEAIRSLKSNGEHDVLRAKWWPAQCSSAARQAFSSACLLLAAAAYSWLV